MSINTPVLGVRVRSQNKLKLKTHCGGLQCLCKDTAWKISGEDKKHWATFLQNESVSPSPQEINQSAIKTYFQLLEFTSSLIDVAHINLQLKVVLAEQPLSEAARSGVKAWFYPCFVCSCLLGPPHTEITQKTTAQTPLELIFTPNQAATSWVSVGMMP